MNLESNYERRHYEKCVFVIGVLLSWYGCSDDNTGTLPISDVTRTTFVDERDMTTYQCIVVNGQTWMAENLRYRLPLGASEGCYTFNEVSVSVSEENFIAEVNAALKSGELVDPMPFPPTESMAVALNSVLFGFMTIDEFKESYVGYPDVAATLGVLESRALTNSISVAFTETEADNGHYSERYGFLYTHEAALKALPEGLAFADR